MMLTVCARRPETHGLEEQVQQRARSEQKTIEAPDFQVRANVLEVLEANNAATTQN
jgi:hypothetical protein